MDLVIESLRKTSRSSFLSSQPCNTSFYFRNMADHKHDDDDAKEVDHGYSLEVSVNNSENTLDINIINNGTKQMYRSFLSPSDLQSAGFPANQCRNLQVVADYIQSAHDGQPHCTFSLEVVPNIEGPDAMTLRVTQSPIIEITLNIPEVPRSKVDINSDLISDLKTRNEALQQRLTEMQQHVMPRGAVVMWTGTADTIPNGWRLCDGTNGTPDLRNRFIIGASNQHPVDQNGGNETHSHQITVNGHRLTTAQIPAHSHRNTKSVMHTQPTSPWGYVFSYDVKYASLHRANNSVVPTDSIGGNQPHSHTATSNAVPHLPPFYALCFIKKIV